MNIEIKKDGEIKGEAQCGLFVLEAHQQLFFFSTSCCQHARPRGSCLHPVTITGPVSFCSKHTHAMKQHAISSYVHAQTQKAYQSCFKTIHPTVDLYTWTLNIYKHPHTAISCGVMITDFRGRQTAEQQILRCNGFILIVPRNQYQATLISHS